MDGKLDRAFQRSKTAIESMYWDTVTVYKRGSISDSVGFDDVEKPLIALFTDIPAKLSKNGLNAATAEAFAGVNYDAVVFLDGKYKIPSGAILDIKNVNGDTKRYYLASGSYTNYHTHQELAVTFNERK